MDVYDKPFKTFDELVDLLQIKHGLAVPDREVAKQILQCTPYYDLVNGYKDIFMTNDQYDPAIDFTDLYLTHILDRDFQNVLFELSVIVEDYFKNILAYVVAGSFGVDESAYLSFDHYLSLHAAGTRHEIRRDKVIPSLRHIARCSLDNPTLYYRTRHNHIPPWILLKNTTFSLSSNLLTLLKRPQKQQVLRFMLPIDGNWDQQFPILLYTLTLVRKCRNTIAHNLKFTSFSGRRYMNNLDKSLLRQLIPEVLLRDSELDGMMYLDGVYGYLILSLCLIPDRISKYVIINRLFNVIDSNPLLAGDMQSIGDRVKSYYFRGIRVPLDFRERLSSYVKSLFLEQKA